ncbi:MAG: hypothetical protein IAG10_15355 [Planctomycetaceae bacterium]|nr:hypothetical protein [Planctomycetaceae bacterium]
MSVVHFQCPSCQAPLRLENRALFVGRTFDCPDCGESLLIEADGNTGVKAKRSNTTGRHASEGIETSAANPSLARRASFETASKVSDRGVDLQSPMPAWDRLSRRPALLGWIVAALFAVVLLVVMNPGRGRGLPDAAMPVAADNKTPEAIPQESANQNTAVKPDPVSSKSNDQIPDAAGITDAEKNKDHSEPPPSDVSKDSPRDNKPPATTDPAEKLAPEEPKPVAVPPPPEPAPASLALSTEAIESKLRQKIARFDQVKPVAFVKLMDSVEELAGVPIVWDLRITEEQFQKLVTIRLKETTVGEILDTLLKQVGLERRIVEGKIELRLPVQ